MQQRSDINGILLAIYMWMFMILRLAWAFNSKYSTLILGALSLIIISICFVKSKEFLNKYFVTGLVVALTVIFFLLIDILIRDNDVVKTRLYEFVINGVIPIVLFSQIRNFRSFFKTYVILSIIVFFVYVADPINHYFFTSGYMVYGFQAMLPAFFGLHIGRKEFSYKFLLILEVISLVMMSIFGNRMATLAALVFFVMFDLSYKKITLIKIFKYFCLLGLAFLVMINLQPILQFLASYFAQKGYSSYAIDAILFYLNGTIDSLTSGRDILWSKAIDLIQVKPIFGYGVGYYESVNGIYPHNFILEILLSYGIVGLIIYLLLLLHSVYRISKSDKYIKLFGIFLMCTSFPKLFTSVYTFIEPTFWMFIFYGFYVKIYCKEIEFVRRKQVLLDERINSQNN